MTHTCEALTLRSYPFGEANKVVVFLTREQGLLRGVAYGAKSSRTRFGPSLEPMTHVRVTFRQKEDQELAVIQNCEIIRALPAYELSLEQNLYFGYFAEVLSEFARERVESERLFRLTLAVLAAAAHVPLVLLSRYFEFWVLRLEGVLPRLDGLFPAPLADKALRMLRASPGDLGNLNWLGEELELLESAAEKLLEYHLEKPLKSKRMLKELL